MLSLQRKLVETCTIAPNTTNRYGDKVFGTAVTTKCLFRDISTQRQVNYQEGVSIDGIFCFPPDSAARRGNIIAYNSEYFRIMKVIKGKRTMLDDTTDFIKCEVIRIRQVS